MLPLSVASARQAPSAPASTRSTICSAPSNYGYVVLTSVVEKAAGLDFLVALQQFVLDPAGLSGIWRAMTPESGRLPGEVTYTAPGKGQSNFAPQTQEQEPFAYGGEGILETTEGAGGLVTDALTVARFISNYAVWGTGLRSPGLTRSGGMAGTSTIACSMPNGVDFAFLFNRRIDDPPLGGFVQDVRDALAGA